jgi:ABC-type multidrug transport system ATPase subunit
MLLENLGREVGGKLKILQEINLVIEPNEFVALLGPSGSGKSTLMNAMTGRQKATEGTITLNGDNLYKNSTKYRGQIGHVPQKDIVHLPLTVQQELTFAARLRLPSNRSSEAINERVETVIEQIGLQERKQTKNMSLSGGQLKRVSVGVEILSDPQLLFLDEATSGLDAGIEARMMSLFRRLADEGRTVVCVTHNLDNVCLCDLVAVLVGGRLAYYGPPSDLPAYFNVEKVAQVYACLEGAPPEEWAQRFKASPYYEEYVARRQREGGISASDGNAEVPAKPNGAAHQFFVLTHRYLSVAFQDYKNIIILLVQAPIIAGLIGLVFHSESFDKLPKGPHNQQTLSFLLVISAIWFGCINSAREIVKELDLYLREQAIGLNLASYLGSKVAVLGFFCSLQCVALLAISLAATPFRPNAGLQLGCLLLTSLGGMLMGLLVSSLMKNEDKAVGLVPILLIPQVVFGGAMLKLSGTSLGIAKAVVLSFWALDAMLHSLSSTAQDNFPPSASLRCDLAYIGIFLAVLTLATVVVLMLKRASK